MILLIRNKFCIPLSGLETYKEALDWYKKHYRLHKGRAFKCELGYKFDITGRQLEYDIMQNSKGIYISAIPQLDDDVPLDKSISDLMKNSGIEEWKGPAMRVIVLMARIGSSDEIPPIPEWFSAQISGFRLLGHRKNRKRLREWRRIGEHSGFLESGKEKKVECNLVIEYGGIRNWGKTEQQYWDVFCAYRDILDDRMKAELEGKPLKGKRGINIEIGKKLVENYEWGKSKIESYKISRYLKRAKMRWYASILRNYNGSKKPFA